MKTALDIAALTIQFCLLLDFTLKLTDKEKRTLGYRLSGMAVCFLMSVAVSLLIHLGGFTVLCLGIPVICYIAYVLLFLDTDIYKKLFVGFFSLSLIVIVFTFSSILIHMFIVTSYRQIFFTLTVEHYSFLLISNLLFFYASRIILKFNHSEVKGSRRDFAFLTGIPAVSIVSIIAMLQVSEELFINNEKIQLVVTVISGVVIINLLSYYFYVEIGKDYEKSLKYEIVKKQNEFLTANAYEIEKYYDDARKMYHDLRKYLMIVLSYLENEQKNEAESYIHQLLNLNEGILQHRILCDNNTVNFILNYSMGKCINSGIDCTCTVTASLKNIEDKEFCIILNNLFDNAYEASLKEKEGKVFVIIEKEDGDSSNIQLIIKNKINSSVLEKNPGLETTKPGSKKHGYGLRNVRDLLEKINGQLYCYEEAGFFNCNVMVPVLQKEEIDNEKKR